MTPLPIARRLAVLGLILLAACTDSPVDPPPALTPTLGDTSLLVNSLTPKSDAPAIANPVVQFYAVAGQSREAFMYYRSRPGRADSVDFIRFKVPQEALLARPNGTPFAPGDSVLITITLIDPARLLVRFEPSGLRFSTTDPAELKFSFLETEDDRDEDGEIDDDDTLILTYLDIWRRETPTAPWIRQSSALTVDDDEIETDVFGFTDYIIAW